VFCFLGLVRGAACFNIELPVGTPGVPKLVVRNSASIVCKV